MKRLAILALSGLLVGCNTDGFSELSTVYVRDHYPEVNGDPLFGSLNNTVRPEENANLPAFCKSLTKKTCKQIKSGYPATSSPYDTPLGCTEVQQQQACFKDKDEDNDRFLCEEEYKQTCVAL